MKNELKNLRIIPVDEKFAYNENLKTNPSIVESSLMGMQSLAQQVDHRSLVLTN